MLSIKHPHYPLFIAGLYALLFFAGHPGTSTYTDEAVKQRKNPYAIGVSRARGFKRKLLKEDLV